MDFILEFIRPELFVLIAFLYAVGLFIKTGPWGDNSWAIPHILLGISLVITFAYMGIFMGEGFSPPVIVASVIQAVLIAAVTVYGNELIQQFIHRKGE